MENFIIRIEVISKSKNNSERIDIKLPKEITPYTIINYLNGALHCLAESLNNYKKGGK